MDFDETRLYYSHQQLQRNTETNNDDAADNNPVDGNDSVDLKAVRRHFREFLRKLYMVLLVLML